MNDSEINDIREQKDFKGISFSEFKKTDVKKELIHSLLNAKIEPCCYWSAELICAGHYLELWEIIIHFYAKHIHIGNPKIAIYLNMRINNFKELINSGYLNQELRLRNHPKMRRLFCEIMCVLCEAKRRHSYDEVKIRKEDFDMTHMTERFKAPEITYAENVFKKDDPKELFVAVNEFAYNISVKNCLTACYWLEWILEFEVVCKAKKERIFCERRAFADVDPKLQMDIIWIIWDVLIQEATNTSAVLEKVMTSLLNLFCLKYTQGCTKKRKLILYYGIALLTEIVSFNEEIVHDKEKIAIITDKIDNIYKQIKKNEHSPGTDYLYTNTKAKNLEKTIEKLEKMNTFGAEYVPRL
jgi:hypothetical protein